MDSKSFRNFTGDTMKLFIWLAFFLLLLSPMNYTQWVQQSTDLSINIQKISFIDSLTGYLIDDAGHLAKTTNGGDSWVVSNTGFNAALRGIHFTSESTGYISSFNGLIIKTIDGGITWFQQQSHTTQTLDDFAFTNSNTGYLVGDAGTIVKTKDAGLNWTVMPYFTQEDFRTVCFTDSLNGYIAGTNSYRTTNGGITWLQIINGSNIGRCVSFPDPNTGYVGGNYGTIYKTTDKGVTWTQQNSSTSNDLYGIYFLNNQRGYAVGLNGTIIGTTNGGTNWINLESGTSLYLASIFFLNNNKGFCTGGYPTQAILLKTTNGGFPVPGIHVTSPNGGEVWLANTSNSLTWTSKMVSYLNLDFTTNNGETWNSIATNYPATNNSYTWNEPATQSSKCKIRVMDASDPTLGDSSDNVFKINSINLTSPTGGENWQILSNQNITCTGINVVNVNIDFTTNSGQVWNNIAYQISNTGNYSWNIPNAISNLCKVRVTETSDTANYSESNNYFHIVPEIVKAVVSADTIYYDTGFLGNISKQVSGSKSTGTNLNYEWSINDTMTYTGISPMIILHTGINKILLKITGQSGVFSIDSAITNVIASRNITGGAIYSGVSQYNNHFYTTSMDKGVYEIDSIGNKLKSFLTGGSIQSVLSISQQGKLFTGSTDTRLYGFETTLLPIWDKSTGGIVKSAPALSYDGSTVYCVTTTANVIAFDVQSGNIKWGFATDGYVTNSPVVFYDSSNTNIIYVGTCNGILYAIRDKGTTGELFWQKQLSDTIFSSVAIYPDGSNSMLFVGSKDGYLYRIRWDGMSDDSWKVDLASPVFSSPVLDRDGLIYIGTKSGILSVYAKDFSNSSIPLTSFAFESGIIGTPAIGNNGNIYAGTEKGFLYSLENSTQNLKLNWKANLYSSINSSALVTESGLIYMGTLTGDIFVLKENMLGNSSTKTTLNNLRSKVPSVILTGIKDAAYLNSTFQLLQNYPNPFNPTTKIKYTVGLNNKLPIQIKIYDLLGKEVAFLLNEHKDPGNYEIDFDAGKYNLPSGMYIYLIRAGEFCQARKMILLK
jgi:photosystem II stability/assembly factor-like uncharacterized protein